MKAPPVPREHISPPPWDLWLRVVPNFFVQGRCAMYAWAGGNAAANTTTSFTINVGDALLTDMALVRDTTLTPGTFIAGAVVSASGQVTFQVANLTAGAIAVPAQDVAVLLVS